MRVSVPGRRLQTPAGGGGRRALRGRAPAAPGPQAGALRLPGLVAALLSPWGWHQCKNTQTLSERLFSPRQRLPSSSFPHPHTRLPLRGPRRPLWASVSPPTRGMTPWEGKLGAGPSAAPAPRLPQEVRVAVWPGRPRRHSRCLLRNNQAAMSRQKGPERQNMRGRSATRRGGYTRARAPRVCTVPTLEGRGPRAPSKGTVTTPRRRSRKYVLFFPRPSYVFQMSYNDWYE